MIGIWQHQSEAVQSIWDYFRSGKTGNPVVCMPTGTGKSVVIAKFLQSIYGPYPHQKVLVLTHVKELIEQNYNKLLQIWPFAPAGIYSAGLNKRDSIQPIVFGGIASVAKRANLFKHVDLVIVDEAHLVSPSDSTMYRSFLAQLKEVNPYLKVIGFTATPWRLGHGRIIDPILRGDEEIPSLFTDYCFDITDMNSFNRLIAEGFLMPLIPKRTRTLLDVDGVHMRGGEFIESELQLAVDKHEITMAALREAMEIAHDRKKWLVFASGVDHADHICDALNHLGIKAGCVHSKMEGRDETIAAFKAGKIRAIVNNNVLTTGFDEPGIDCIIMLRPTASTVLWVQMLGRGTRPVFAPGHNLSDINGRLNAIAEGGKRDCLVLDYAGNTKRLGPVNDPVIPRKKGEGGGTAPVKVCAKCNTYVHASVRHCPHCDFEFTFQTKIEQDASSAKLIAGELPVIEVFDVNHITYQEHRKEGSPPSLKVTYFCGLSRFTEWVTIENSRMRGFANRWWSQRTSLPLPNTVADALSVTDELMAATSIRVWTNKKWPEILAHCFDGSAFNTRQPSSFKPKIESYAPHRPSKLDVIEAPPKTYDIDDEIPF